MPKTPEKNYRCGLWMPKKLFDEMTTALKNNGIRVGVFFTYFAREFLSATKQAHKDGKVVEGQMPKVTIKY